MCTVTWLHSTDRSGGYQLFCNRDEKHTRGLAAPPTVIDGDVRFLAPRDPDGGGAWLSVNELGISVCLLNGTAPMQHDRGTNHRSRGGLVWMLANSRSVQDVASRISSMPLDSYAPFVMVALGPNSRSFACAWNGWGRLQIADPCAEAWMPLVSSSFEAERVAAARREDYQLLAASSSGGVTEKGLLAFHQSHGDRPSAYSTCMHRDDAETVSFSRIRVSESEVSFTYLPGAPCNREHVPYYSTTLPRLRG